MNIYMATDDFHYSVSELFAKYGEVKILPQKYEDYRNLKVDLMIFSGGEDVNPVRYGEFNKKIYFNESRDEREFTILQDIMRGRTNIAKVFGICRGLQVINVAMGGTLIPDITEKYGRPHDGTHPLIWKAESPMKILQETNSLHHQGIQSLGTRFRPTVLAVEPLTNVTEVITWADSFFAVQFHPEFFPDSLIKREIARMIIQWSKGELLLNPAANAKHKPMDFSYAESNFKGTWANLDNESIRISELNDTIMVQDSEEDEEILENSDEESEDEE